MVLGAITRVGSRVLTRARTFFGSSAGRAAAGGGAAGGAGGFTLASILNFGEGAGDAAGDGLKKIMWVMVGLVVLSVVLDR